jgi:hypothetical protein
MLGSTFKRISKHQVLAKLRSGHVRKDMGKSVRVEGKVSRPTVSAYLHKCMKNIP